MSLAALLSAQVQSTVTWHDVTRVDYKLHRKEGKPDSMRVDYYSGILQCASEWVCFDHTGYASQKAVAWWLQRSLDNTYPNSVARAIEVVMGERPDYLRKPRRIATRKNGKFTEVKEYEFD